MTMSILLLLFVLWIVIINNNDIKYIDLQIISPNTSLIFWQVNSNLTWNIQGWRQFLHLGASKLSLATTEVKLFFDWALLLIHWVDKSIHYHCKSHCFDPSLKCLYYYYYLQKKGNILHQNISYYYFLYFIFAVPFGWVHFMREIYVLCFKGWSFWIFI